YSGEIGARVHLTGQGGDLIMGNWFDDSEQLARPLRRAQIVTAFRDAVHWSRVTRVPAPTLLWRALLSNLPAGWGLGPTYELSTSRAIRERYGDSLTSRLKSTPEGVWPDCWKEVAPERRKLFRSVSRARVSGSLFRPPERLQHLYYT